jgi:hypothetical protein
VAPGSWTEKFAFEVKLCRVNIRLPEAGAARRSRLYRESCRQETNAAGAGCKMIGIDLSNADRYAEKITKNYLLCVKNPMRYELYLQSLCLLPGMTAKTQK